MKVRSLILAAAIVLFFAAGCSKSNTSLPRDQFIGNYHMHDSIVYSIGVGGNAGSFYYDMSVIADPSHSDRVIFNNIANYGHADTAVVSGTLASFTVCPQCTTARNVTTALVTGSSIRLSGGDYTAVSGYTSYASGTGIKF